MDDQNPFFHRGPIRDQAFFFGRQDEVSRTLALLANGQSVSIVGPRRIGKTSLLLRLARSGAATALGGAAAGAPCMAYLDCESWRTITPGELYALLLEEMVEALAASGKPLDVAPPAAPISYRTLDQAVRAIVGQGIQPVFLLDEFETLSASPHLDADVFSGLRALAMRHGVAYATVSTRPLLDLSYAHPSTLGSPFFNFFAQIRLGLLSDEAAAGLLTGLAERAGHPFEPPTIAQLLDLSGPHPLLLQIAGYHAFEHLGRSGWRRDDQPLDARGVEIVRRAFTDEAVVHWSFFWHALAPEDQRLLALLPVAGRADREGVQRLERAGLVRRDREADGRSLSPAFAAFVARQPAPGLVQAPPVTLAPASHVALLRGQRLDLTPTEFRLLTVLVANAGRVVTRRELQNLVWEAESITEEDRLKTAISELRRHLGADKDCIQTAPRAGYWFAPDQG